MMDPAQRCTAQWFRYTGTMSSRVKMFVFPSHCDGRKAIRRAPRAILSTRLATICRHMNAFHYSMSGFFCFICVLVAASDLCGRPVAVATRLFAPGPTPGRDRLAPHGGHAPRKRSNFARGHPHTYSDASIVGGDRAYFFLVPESGLCETRGCPNSDPRCGGCVVIPSFSPIPLPLHVPFAAKNDVLFALR